MMQVDKITPYPDINEILLDISDNIQNILGQNLIGLYGKEMSSRNETINFIKFTIDKIKHTDIYQQMR